MRKPVTHRKAGTLVLPPLNLDALGIEEEERNNTLESKKEGPAHGEGEAIELIDEGGHKDSESSLRKDHRDGDDDEEEDEEEEEEEEKEDDKSHSGDFFDPVRLLGREVYASIGGTDASCVAEDSIDEQVKHTLREWVQDMVFGLHATKATIEHESDVSRRPNASPARVAGEREGEDEGPFQATTVYQHWLAYKPLVSGRKCAGAEEFETCEFLETTLVKTLGEAVDLKLELWYRTPTSLLGRTREKEPLLNVKIQVFSTSGTFYIPYEIVRHSEPRLRVLFFLVENAASLFLDRVIEEQRSYVTLSRLRPSLTFLLDPERLVYTFCYAVMIEAVVYRKFLPVRQVLHYAVRRASRRSERLSVAARTFLDRAADELPSLGIKTVAKYLEENLRRCN